MCAIAGGGLERKRALVAVGAVPAIVGAMRLHTHDAGVQGNGCMALGHVAAGDDACKQAVADAGGVAVLATAMGTLSAHDGSLGRRAKELIGDPWQTIRCLPAVASLDMGSRIDALLGPDQK